jgi:hypothetical protein
LRSQSRPVIEPPVGLRLPYECLNGAPSTCARLTIGRVNGVEKVGQRGGEILGQGRRLGRRPQLGDQPQNVGEQVSGDRDFGHLEGDIARLAENLRADLEQLFPAEEREECARSDPETSYEPISATKLLWRALRACYS